MDGACQPWGYRRDLREKSTVNVSEIMEKMIACVDRTKVNLNREGAKGRMKSKVACHEQIKLISN